MLQAAGFRVFRMTVTKSKLRGKADPANFVRDIAKRKGLVLAMDGVNPQMPFRFREVRKGVIELDQVQSLTGSHAMAPPEQHDFVERFLQGEPWVGTVKTVAIP